MAGEKLYGDQMVAFHSEYHINTDWRCITRDMTNGYNEDMARKGYCRYSFYEGKLYYIRNRAGGIYVVEANIEQKKCHIYKVDTREVYEFVVVNAAGIFLYNTQKISLYIRNERELSHVGTYKFGQKSYVECVYILGYFVVYSETLTANCKKSINILNMQNGNVGAIWESHEGDTHLDDAFRRAYGDKPGCDTAAVKFASSAKKSSCEFLYANDKRIIAGYTGSRSGNGSETQISYIIEVNSQKKVWRVMEAFASSYSNNSLKGHQSVPHVFSFDMRQDVVWVKQEPKFLDKLNGSEICMVPIDFYPKATRGNASFYIPENIKCKKLYFDGQYAYELAANCLYRLVDGQEQKLDMHYYPNYDFWCWGDTYRVPTAASDESVELNGYVRVKIDGSILDNAIAEKSKPRSPEPVKKKVESKPDIYNRQFTLGQFRELAPRLVGGRDELLEYRKSLPQKWDYNAFVGILLGLHARKVGDVASANFAFGQGDNNKSVDKKFDEHGLWDIFNKYKKSDGHVKLSQVEDEIIAQVPEYKAIREKFDTVLQRLLKYAGM